MKEQNKRMERKSIVTFSDKESMIKIQTNS